MNLDESVARFCYEVAAERPWLLDLAKVVSVGLHPWVWRGVVLGAGVWAWRRARRGAGVAAVATMTVGSLLGGAAKILVDRPRPSWDVPLAVAEGMSMPSGHALNATMSGGLLLALAWRHLGVRGRRLTAACYGLVVIIVGLDRLLLGVHYLSDVVVGTAMGAVLAVVGATIIRRADGPDRSADTAAVDA